MSHKSEVIQLTPDNRPVLMQALANYITDCNYKKQDITIEMPEGHKLYAHYDKQQIIASKIYADLK